METNYNYLLLALIILIFVIGIIVGAFLSYFISGKYKKILKPPFQFYHKENLYNFNDAFVLLDWYHGDESQNHTYLVRFPDQIYFKIEFHNYGIPPEVEEYTKERMIKRLKKEVESFPEKALAALKLLET